MSLACLNNIIGLSQTTCPCLDTDKPQDYNLSNSGIFLDQLDGFNIDMAGAADDCAQGGIWDRMQSALAQATLDYKNNLLGCIGTNYKPRIETLNVQLSDSTFQGSANITQRYAGVKIMPATIKGGVIVIKRIGILVNASVPVTVKVYSNIPGNDTQSTLLYQSTPIMATADTLVWSTLSTPLELPMWSYAYNNFGGLLRYYVVFDLDGTYQPKNNRKDCGCAGKRPYLQWMDFTGVTGTDANNPDGSFGNSIYSNGIVLDAQIKCKTTDIICSDEYPIDFEDSSYNLNMAYAIRFRTAAILYEYLLSSTIINRFTMLNRDYVNAKITEWNSEYMNWINYLCANFNFGVNDCLVCRTTDSSLIKTSINVVGSQFQWINGYNPKY